MRPLLAKRHSRGAVREGRRGMAMLEFLFILPALMFFLLLTFDIGRVSLMSGALHDAANQAARAGAQAGGGCINLATGSAPSSCSESSSGAVSVRSFTEAFAARPGVDASRATLRVESGGVCLTAASSNHVIVSANYDAPLVTPGLTTLLGITSEGPWQLSARAVARCEIVRR